ncbi:MULTISPECIES: Lrp/AsnC family transcriptional regulator [Anaerostipes]|uniref:Lrp/AsnC family transcriptional regulator n=1 Tax=Anaerostipes TaxID=207244 RepID=UPI000951A30A|nr:MULTISPECIES: Lrp/AsnC family transcriptional regulator [Anaerostipes]MCI5623804.1 Lrp/AsnC family transcriptional regulator [Anaerostipes sp.]MDY2727328.1 Lrp/AsnC family transcriptional regulator [Anaerostipes faecalis]OLR58780.1 AsnC family transcriptional regulator [Anaerostipes sp. 494a]
MDAIDRKIISILQKDARTPIKAIASEVFLTSPAVSSRIERLEKDGILTGYQAIVNPLKLGYHIKAYVNLEISPSQKPEVYPYLDAHPNVLECDCVTGNYSVLIKVAFPSTMELDLFIGELQHFGKTNTFIVFSTIVENRGVSSRKYKNKSE